MYAPFFGLKHEPFSIAPDPRYLFMSERHREALAHLLYGVNGGGGFVLLSGEIGAGKTTVCRCFLEQIPRRCNVAYIVNPKLTVIELLKTVCEEFGIPNPPPAHSEATVKDYLDPLNQFLLKTHAVGQNNVLIIDEAQMLSAEVLEQLRLLTNLETNERKLLQIVLIGQPELRDMLARPELEQLAQRVIARYHLGALTETETGQYIRHRLAVAGMTSAMPFDAPSLARIHQLSRGVPRRINLLCDRALLGAYASGKGQVDRAIVEKAAVEVFGKDRMAARRRRKRARAMRWALGAVAAAAALAGVVLVLNGSPRGAAPGAGKAPPKASTASAGGAGAMAPARIASGAGAAPATSATSAAPATSALTAPASIPPISPAASAGAFLTAADLQARYSELPHDEAAAWRALAPAWQITADGADPCAPAQRGPVQCFHSANTTLALIRQLDRPGILTLHDASDRPVYALLTGLSPQSATLQLGKATQTLSLVSLATLWRGDFATYWRAPPGYAGKVVDGNTGALATWVTEQLARLNGAAPAASGPATDAAWQARVAAFQRSQGLRPDGLAGPTTFMQLNRALGVDEPHLHTGPAGH
ncbi:MAG: AAA family ATPase [Burkholderiales bacterium]|nr:AAA family ATPase [Burkholderiales bacterium]